MGFADGAKGPAGTLDMYHQAGGESQPADTGHAMGANLMAREFSARQEFAQPAVNTGWNRTAADEVANPSLGAPVAGAPEWYNTTAAPPVKYSVPTAQKEYMQRKEAILRNAPPLEGVTRMTTVDENDVAYLKSMEEQAELADFDRYVQSLINPRKPGNMKFLMEIYPQFVERRIKQAHTDYSFAIRKQMIDQWGVNTFDDLHFLYLLDQGKIAGPKLETPGRDVGNKYQAGWLAPGAYKRTRHAGIRLPFASADFGESAGDVNAWTMPDGVQALSRGRDREWMASNIYAPDPTSDGVNPRQTLDRPSRAALAAAM